MATVDSIVGLGAVELVEVDKHTAVDTYQWLRESAQLQTVVVLGVPALFRHKPIY